MSDLLRLLLALTMVSTLAIGIVLLARRPVRRAFGAAAAYCTWLLVPVAMIAVLLPDAPADSSAIGVSFQVEPLSTVSRAIERSLAPSSATTATVSWAAWLLSAWCVGVALCSLYLAGLQRAFVGSLGILYGSRAVLRAQRPACGPVLIGFFAPKVVLPQDFASRFSRFERRLVLAHERVHLRRLDAMSNALVALLRCVFWFNPLVHLAAGYFRLDQELACDAAVMERHPGTRRLYAGAMLKAQTSEAALPVGCHWQSANQIRERLHMLKRSTPSRARRVSGSLFVTLAAATVGYSAWAAEPRAADAVASTATPSSPATHDHLILTLEIDAAVLRVEGFDGPVTVTGERIATTRPLSDPAARTVMEHVRIASAPESTGRVTITSASKVFTGRDFRIGADNVTFTPSLEAWTFEKGCTVKLTIAARPDLLIEGSKCGALFPR